MATIEPRLDQAGFRHPWGAYWICLCPLPLLAYLGLESYGIDYRAFYLAGKAALHGLNPYLNHIAVSSDFYGPINAELAYYSGWKYPPLSTYLFCPLALLPYELSKNIFNLISVVIAFAVGILSIRLSGRRIPPEAFLIVLVGFPVVATLERGQVEILLVASATVVAYWISRGRITIGMFGLVALASLKIYPIVLAAILPRLGKAKVLRGLLVLGVSAAALSLMTIALPPDSWLGSFRQRASIEFDRVPGQVLQKLPEGTGVIEGTMTVRSSDSRNLIHSHDFVFGFGNPLLTRMPLLAAAWGVVGSAATMRMNRRQPLFQQILALMPWINIFNPLSWIMGLCWYVPLFVYSYQRLKPSMRFVFALPLILPPALNASGYLAAALSLVASKAYVLELDS